jgi:hypothetical protein
VSAMLDVPTAEAQMAEATARTGGLTNFGPPTFRDGL